MPDWRNLAEYAYTEGFSLHDWAWEFLRRSRDYRTDWAELQRIKPHLSSGEFLEACKRVGTKYGLGLAADPSLSQTEAGIIWMIGAGVKLLYGIEKVDLGAPWPGFPTMAFLVFNLLEDAESQLDDARRILGIFQWRLANELGYPPQKAGSAKPQTDKFPFYLSLLDARLEGLSQRDIGLELYPESFEPRDKVRHAVEAAEELARSGYRDLLYRPNI